MTKKRTLPLKKRKHEDRYTAAQRAYLSRPDANPPCGFMASSEDLPYRFSGCLHSTVHAELRVVWQVLRDEVMAEFADRPFTRPFGFWHYDSGATPAPSPRNVEAWLVDHPQHLTNTEKRILAERSDVPT